MKTIFRLLTAFSFLVLTNLTAAETARSRATDAVIDEMQDWSAKARDYDAVVECAKGEKIDQLSSPECQNCEASSDCALKREEVLENADVEIQYESGIDRNRAPGLVQAIMDFFDFLCFWK